MKITAKRFSNGYRAVVTKEGRALAVTLVARRNRNACVRDGLSLLSVVLGK